MGDAGISAKDQLSHLLVEPSGARRSKGFPSVSWLPGQCQLDREAFLNDSRCHG
jgi:hypothetical protein